MLTGKLDNPLWHAVWLENPLLYFADYPDADVLASTDSVAPTRDDGGLENPDVIGRYDLNVGMFLHFPIDHKSFAPKQDCCHCQYFVLC